MRKGKISKLIKENGKHVMTGKLSDVGKRRK